MRTIDTRVRALLGTAGATLMALAVGVLPAGAAGAPTIAVATFTAPTGASLDNPQGIAVNNGTIDVSNTLDSVVASIVGTATATIAGSYVFGGWDPVTADRPPRRHSTRRPGWPRTGGVTSSSPIRKTTSCAVDAELDNPQAVAVDAVGDVFIADKVGANNVIREVTRDGRIVTYAGIGRPGYRERLRPARDGPSCPRRRASRSTPSATSISPTPATT